METIKLYCYLQILNEGWALNFYLKILEAHIVAYKYKQK